MSDEERQVREIFGPGSNSAKASQVAKFDPQKYAALKVAACYTYGIIPESMVPMQHRLTREQLDAKARAEAAAQRDERILLPEEVCSRLHLPLGTRMTFAQMQAALGKRVE